MRLNEEWKYILDGAGNPVPEPDTLKWGQWFEDSMANDCRTVARPNVGKFQVSTVFLGLDHSFGGEYPVLFETMIFRIGAEPDDGTKWLDFQERYSTRAEALEGHKRAVEWATKYQQDGTGKHGYPHT